MGRQGATADQPNALMCLGRGGGASTGPRRRLFGADDPEQSKAFVDREMQKLRDQDMRCYNFDFAQWRPLKGSYKWEVLTHTGWMDAEATGGGDAQLQQPISARAPPGDRESAGVEAGGAEGATQPPPSGDAAATGAQPDRQTIIPEFFTQKKRGAEGDGKRDDDNDGGAGDGPSDGGEGRTKKPRSFV